MIDVGLPAQPRQCVNRMVNPSCFVKCHYLSVFVFLHTLFETRSAVILCAPLPFTVCVSKTLIYS